MSSIFTKATRTAPDRTYMGDSKESHYKWEIVDEPGRFAMISKHELVVDHTYQREQVRREILDIAAAWSWLKCTCLIVARRDHRFVIIDGQQRHAAAMKRSSIDQLPCLVFETQDVQEEATAFLGINTGRRVVSAVERHKAKLVAGDPLAALVQALLDDADITLIGSGSGGAGTTKCVAVLERMASADRDAFERIVRLSDRICRQSNMPLGNKILEGLWYLDQSMLEGGLSDSRARRRVIDVGADVLQREAIRAASLYAKGGARVWATGMLQALNKGLHKKLVERS